MPLLVSTAEARAIEGFRRSPNAAIIRTVLERRLDAARAVYEETAYSAETSEFLRAQVAAEKAVLAALFVDGLEKHNAQ